MWRLDCRLKYVCYLIVIKFVIFDYFCDKMHLFLGSLWRALHWNATTPPVLLSCFCLVPPTKQKQKSNTLERFVWRLDCRLKYVWYLTLLKFVIFTYFSGKIRLFLRSLWRALQSGNSPVVSYSQFFCFAPQNKKQRITN